MSIIEQIYQNRINEEQRIASERVLDKEIYGILLREQYETEGKLSNLFFEASSCGQVEGFSSGIRLAVALMVECLS